MMYNLFVDFSSMVIGLVIVIITDYHIKKI